jgi:hypothetical protein
LRGFSRWRTAWNWKSALVSAIGRAPIFFVANLSAGLPAALAAFQTEFLYRVIAAGFFGALTEYFARLPSPRTATWAALIVLPTLAHGVEYIVHFWAGTARIGPAIMASIAISVATTRFSLFVMRRGLFVSRGHRSFSGDVVELLRIIGRALGVAGRRTPAPGPGHIKSGPRPIAAAD